MNNLDSISCVLRTIFHLDLLADMNCKLLTSVYGLKSVCHADALIAKVKYNSCQANYLSVKFLDW